MNEGKQRAVAVRRLVILLAAVACIGIGIASGGARDVLQKAVTICYECIGIG